MSEVLQWIEAIAGVATAAAVLLAWWQIRLTQRQALTDFEDGLAREYREIAQTIPVDALLGGELDDEAFAAAFEKFYRYVDLSNEQVFLRMMGRISEATWRNWCSGIRSPLERPVFRRAWEEIKRRSGDGFGELRRLERSEFREDPRTWVRGPTPPWPGPRHLPRTRSR